MNTKLDWQQIAERQVTGGRAVIAERTREADLGHTKRIEVEQFGTWIDGEDGVTGLRTFDFRRDAAEDFNSRT